MLVVIGLTIGRVKALKDIESELAGALGATGAHP